jgi:uncharacterized membrane protein (DUF4010 family)
VSLELGLDVAGDLGVAALAGLAVGIERQWSGHASGPHGRFAGARTFLLLGLLGGLAGWLFRGGVPAPAILLLAGAALLTVAAYVMATRREGAELDGTTEVAALVVLGLGTAAGLGFPLLTSAAISVTVLVLMEKGRIHEFIGRIGQRELEAALQFAVLALVILPLLPEGPYGPFDSIRPRTLWAVVLLFSGLNFVGYAARRAFGGGRGYGITGLLGGLLSSTAVTLSFSRLSREQQGMSGALASGVLGACTMLLPRVLLVSAIITPAVALALLPYLIPPLVVGCGFVAWAMFRPAQAAELPSADQLPSPLGLWSAIKMAIAFQAVLLAIPLVSELWSTPGVIATAALLGLTDVDALTYTMARMADTPAAIALGAQAIAVGILANTFLKTGIALTLGERDFRRRAAFGLLALAAGSGLGLAIGAR